MPIKLYECLAAEKPVIATRLHGVATEFSQGHVVVCIDDPSEAVSKALELGSKGELMDLGKGRSFVSKNDWKDITDRFETLLERLRSS